MKSSLDLMMNCDDRTANIGCYPTECIVLAGGFGTRLRTVVSDVPKPLALISGVPFLSYLFRHLQRYGIRHVIVSVGYMAEKIVNFCSSYQIENFQISLVLEETPLGTGGGCLKAMSLTKTKDIVVCNGDTLSDCNIWDQYDLHLVSKSVATLGAIYMEENTRYGSLEISESGRIESFLKPGHKNPVVRFGASQTFVNAGSYIFSNTLFAGKSFEENFSLESDFFIPNVCQLQIFASKFSGFFIDIGIPADFDLAQTLLPRWEQNLLNLKTNSHQ